MPRKELEDTFIPVDHVDARKFPIGADVESDGGVRMYCTGSPQTHGDEARWALQVRGPLGTDRGGEAKTFIVSTASLPIAKVKELRDLCTAAIADHAAARVTVKPGRGKVRP